MWALLSRRAWVWLFFVVGAPVIGWLLGKVGDVVEARGGSTRLSRGLHSGRNGAHRLARGPIARRTRSDHRS
jgi:hypothetical protein